MDHQLLSSPLIESAHDLHELASRQNESSPQYQWNAIEKEMLARACQFKHPHLHAGVYVRQEISNDQTACHKTMHSNVSLVAEELRGGS
jgi:hypothetical protein